VGRSGFVYVPDEQAVEGSNVKRFMKRYGIRDYGELIRRSVEDVEWYWRAVVEDLGIEWFSPYRRVMDCSLGLPWTKWFVGGKCNIVHNCLDRHVREGKGDGVAFVWEREDGRSSKVTYSQLLSVVTELAAGMKEMGVKKGDVVGIYMPMCIEAVATMLACSRIGAIHCAVFSGFSPPALATRLNDSGARFLFTADGYQRRGKPINLKASADEALRASPGVERAVVLRYAGIEVPWNGSRDVWLEDVISKGPVPCESMDSEDPLYILYTSGTTGKPKGSVHVHGGYTVYAGQQTAYLIDMQPRDVLFWPADIGWITGQTWSVYGNLIVGSTSLLYDGSYDFPRPDRWWELVERHHVTVFGSSPTAIRTFMKHGESWLKGHDFSRIRVLASTGEPLNPNEWMWFFEHVGGSRSPLINLTGGTEVGGAFVSPLPILPLKVSTVGGPVPGLDMDVVGEDGRPVRGRDGYVVVKKPWPGMTRGLWKDPERYMEAYWSRFEGMWFHGDWALIDEDGYWYLHGRVDDVIKVSGYRIGSAEVEATVEGHPAVLEAAAVGIPHEVRGETLVVCVVLKKGYAPSETLREEIKTYVATQIAKIARPEQVKFVRELPKTRTGKIVRRAIRARLMGEEVGDLSTLEDPRSLEAIDGAA